MIVKETDTAWRVYFFKDAEPEFIKDNWAEKGFKVSVGTKNGKHVPIYVDYSKARFDMATAINSAKRIEGCPLCTEMDSNISNVDYIETKDEIPMVSNFTPQPQPQETAQRLPTDPMASLVKKLAYDAFLTKAGKLMWAQKFNSPELIEELMPKSTPDSLELVADLLDIMTGKAKPVKSKEEIQEFADNIRETVAKARGGESPTGTKGRKTGRTMIIS